MQELASQFVATTTLSGVYVLQVIANELVEHNQLLGSPAHSRCTPARGSRFNSAIRYVYADQTRRLAIVLSEDRTLDIIPLLRRQISRDEFEGNIAALEKADLNNYHEPRNWLGRNRFYSSADGLVQSCISPTPRQPFVNAELFLVRVGSSAH